MPPIGGISFLFLLLVLALLICNAAAGLASGLARGLAFAAAAVLGAGAQVAGFESLDLLHDEYLREKFSWFNLIFIS